MSQKAGESVSKRMGRCMEGRVGGWKVRPAVGLTDGRAGDLMVGGSMGCLLRNQMSVQAWADEPASRWVSEWIVSI